MEALFRSYSDSYSTFTLTLTTSIAQLKRSTSKIMSRSEIELALGCLLLSKPNSQPIVSHPDAARQRGG